MEIAILGGTFNPVHFGHIAMAEYVLEHMGMDRVCFLPNGQPPHKDNSRIAPEHHRLEMLHLAVAENPRFFVSDYETAQNRRCYTVDTMKHFNSLGDGKYHFIIGADSLFQLSQWKNPEELKKICSFIVFSRINQGDVQREAERLRGEGCRIMVADMPRVDVDSTSIRERVRQGLDISAYTPEAVVRYINHHKLYR